MIGQTVSHYRILSRLGQGGMGVVYKAEDLSLQRFVALKFLPPESAVGDSNRSRLVQEARASALLLHPNICPVYEIGESDGRLFIAMAHLEGRSLRELLDDGPLPVDEALRIAKEVGEALSAAHEKGIVHRDVKPGNVMVTPEGRAILMDFGLARMSGATKLTRSGMVVGTAAYMSPEQARGDDVDARSDIWALGVMLYEMVSGELPFQAEYETALLYKIANEDPKPLAGSNIPSGLPGVIAKALAKSVNDRYATAREFIADIDELLGDRQSMPAGHGQPPGRLVKTWRRWRWWERVAAVGVTCAVVAAVAYGGLKLVAPGDKAIDSIGFIPFQNLSGDAKGELWADGVTERLSASMGSIAVLDKIVSDQTMKQFKGSNEPASVIGHKVGAKALVGGSLMLVGDRIEITVKLYEASKDRQIWSSTFSGPVNDIVILQGQIVRAIAQNINAQLTPGSQSQLAAAKPVNPEAYEIYLQGRQYLVKFDPAKAEECYQRAAAIDSTLTVAWAGLANAYTIHAFGMGLTPAEAAPLARAALRKALAQDDQLAETQAALGAVSLNFDWDWKGADVATKRAVELNPTNTEILMQRGLFLYASSRFDECIAVYRRILDLMPLDAGATGNLGYIYFYARHYDDAIAQIRKSDEMAGNHGPNAMVAMCYLMKGMNREALAECDGIPSPGYTELFIYAKLGRPEKAIAFLAAKQRVWDAGTRWNLVDMIALNAALGNRDEAFMWLRRAIDERWPETLQFPTEPYYDSLRSDPRWQEMLKLIHYPNS